LRENAARKVFAGFPAYMLWPGYPVPATEESFVLISGVEFLRSRRAWSPNRFQRLLLPRFHRSAIPLLTVLQIPLE
jgi:hypothetical protein